MDNISKKEDDEIYLNKNATLGGILYHIARHEKSMNWNKLFLAKKQMKQLYVSLEIMTQIMDLLERSEDAILKENNKLAKGYAILSWADVSAKLDEKQCSKIQEMMQYNNSGVDNDWIRLCWCYAQYILDDEGCIDNIFEFLNNTDYHVRYAAVSMLRKFLNKKNAEKIKVQLEQLYKEEKLGIVKELAKKCLDDLQVYTDCI